MRQFVCLSCQACIRIHVDDGMYTTNQRIYYSQRPFKLIFITSGRTFCKRSLFLVTVTDDFGLEPMKQPIYIHSLGKVFYRW